MSPRHVDVEALFRGMVGGTSPDEVFVPAGRFEQLAGFVEDPAHYFEVRDARRNFETVGRSDLSSMRTQHEALFALGLARKIDRDPRRFGSTPKPTEAATEGDVEAFRASGIGSRARRGRR